MLHNFQLDYNGFRFAREAGNEIEFTRIFWSVAIFCEMKKNFRDVFCNVLIKEHSLNLGISSLNGTPQKLNFLHFLHQDVSTNSRDADHLVQNKH